MRGAAGTSTHASPAARTSLNPPRSAEGEPPHGPSLRLARPFGSRARQACDPSEGRARISRQRIRSSATARRATLLRDLPRLCRNAEPHATSRDRSREHQDHRSVPSSPRRGRSRGRTFDDARGPKSTPKIAWKTRKSHLVSGISRMGDTRFEPVTPRSSSWGRMSQPCVFQAIWDRFCDSRTEAVQHSPRPRGRRSPVGATQRRMAARLRSAKTRSRPSESHSHDADHDSHAVARQAPFAPASTIDPAAIHHLPQPDAPDSGASPGCCRAQQSSTALARPEGFNFRGIVNEDPDLDYPVVHDDERERLHRIELFALSLWPVAHASKHEAALAFDAAHSLVAISSATHSQTRPCQRRIRTRTRPDRTPTAPRRAGTFSG